MQMLLVRTSFDRKEEGSRYFKDLPLGNISVYLKRPQLLLRWSTAGDGSVCADHPHFRLGSVGNLVLLKVEKNT